MYKYIDRNIIFFTVGCVLPDHNEVEVELRDGESVAIDWHFSVFEDLLDKQAVCALKRDSTALNDMVCISFVCLWVLYCY